MIHFKKINPTNIFDLCNLKDFYNRIYLKSFPGSITCKDIDTMKVYLNKHLNARLYEHIVTLVYEDGYVIGGCLYNYFARSNSGYVEFIGIDSDYCRANIASTLFDIVKTTLNDSAKSFGNDSVDYIFASIEAQDKQVKSDLACVCLTHKLGFKHVDVKYIQPDKGLSKSIWLLCKSIKDSKDLQQGLIKTVIHEIYRNCFFIDEPNNNQFFDESLRSFENKDILESFTLM